MPRKANLIRKVVDMMACRCLNYEKVGKHLTFSLLGLNVEGIATSQPDMLDSSFQIL